MNSTQTAARFGSRDVGDPTLQDEELTVPRPTAQSMRVEPQLGLPGSRQPTSDELRALAALYDRPTVAPRRRPMKWAGIIAIIFVIGTTVGFGVASLLGGEKGGNVLLPYSHGMQAFAGHGNGTSAGELPYDGKSVDHLASRAQETSGGFNAAELPYNGNISGNSTSESGLAVTPSLAAPESVPVEESRGTDVATPPAAARPEKQAKQAAPRTENKVAVARHPQAQAQARRAYKDREIERIRQQAAEELKKKTDTRSPVVESRNAGHRTGQRNARREGQTRAQRAPAMTAMLEQCEQAGNFLLREQCKWQLCGSKWGKSGCPSYPSRTNPY